MCKHLLQAEITNRLIAGIIYIATTKGNRKNLQDNIYCSNEKIWDKLHIIKLTGTYSLFILKIRNWVFIRRIIYTI